VSWIVWNLGRNWVRNISSGNRLVITSPGDSDSAGREGHQSVRVPHLGSERMLLAGTIVGWKTPGTKDDRATVTNGVATVDKHEDVCW
jgi:hypothetical protein